LGKDGINDNCACEMGGVANCTAMRDGKVNKCLWNCRKSEGKPLLKKGGVRTRFRRKEQLLTGGGLCGNKRQDPGFYSADKTQCKTTGSGRETIQEQGERRGLKKEQVRVRCY